MRDCDIYSEYISRMIDGELSEEEQSQLRAHLDECDECKAVYEAFNDISNALSENLAEAPEALLPGVMSKINSRRSPVRKRKYNYGYLAAMAACLALIVFSVSRYGGGLFGSDNAADSEDSSSMTYMAPAEAPVPEAEDDALRSRDEAAGVGKSAQDVEAETQDSGTEGTAATGAPSGTETGGAEAAVQGTEPEVPETASGDKAPPAHAGGSYYTLTEESKSPLLTMTSAEIYSGDELVKKLENAEDLKLLSELLSVAGAAEEDIGDLSPTYSIVAKFPDGSTTDVDVWVKDDLVLCIYNEKLVKAAGSPEELADFLDK